MNTVKISHNSFFNASRFSAYFRCYAVTNAKSLILFASTVLLIWLLICLLPPITSLFGMYAAPNAQYDPMWNTENGEGVILFVILMALSASRMFTAYHNPRGRTGLLSLPVSSFEKYLTYFLLYIVGFLVVFYASAIVADAIRVGVVKIFAPFDTTPMMRPISQVFTFDARSGNPRAIYTVFTVGSLYLFVLCNAAWFALGSILWSRNPFMKTLGSLFLLNSAMGTLLYYGFKNLDKASIHPNIAVLENDTTIICTLVVGALFTIYIFWLAYRRFVEADIVNRW